MNKGSCLCGDVSWGIDGEILMMSNCHCSMCRKTHGGAYGSYIGVASADFKWLSGEEKIKIYESSAEGLRPFCPRCGSVVAAAMRDGESVFMPIGNMEGDIDVTLGVDLSLVHREDDAARPQGCTAGDLLAGADCNPAGSSPGP